MINLIIPNEVKKYYSENKDKKWFGFSNLLVYKRQEGFTEVFEYRLTSVFSSAISKLSNYLKGAVDTTPHLQGRAAADALEGHLQTNMQKVRAGRFGHAVETVIKHGFGKGLAEQPPGVGCVLDGEYWQEALSDGHSSTMYLGTMYDCWQSSNTSLNFTNWMKTKDCTDTELAEMGATIQDRQECQQGDADAIVQMRGAKIDRMDIKALQKLMTNGGADSSAIPVDAADFQVAYLGAAERSAYRVAIEKDSNILLDANGEPIRNKTLAFVISPDKTMYAGEHVIDRFHHSSFLSAGAVLGAGMVTTNKDGTIVKISNKSGHYKPGPRQMVHVLQILQDRGCDLSKMQLQLMMDEAGIPRGLYQAAEFLAKKR